ncbi:GntR family transcriptional regulator [Roseobacter denitrificans]|uniref:GntR-family transcriptional regulator, putative n=1 Tax=Roseobacter denitrificans (strain ATCC 33942 / OCh 114) TaxID=375451 RepID=Q160Z6_ROSDO|nr:GntR family transcriptional regulator [Roseobacter denitrificans]ABG33447.1 GntR-family transcriptional regulator, putative [Roseobacter denitrificans OCh 114]AVL54862.1 GntR family transcriptional regulator [Roseobacter denitrificans]SFG49527.1 transcriptional regulator, GntR family [Roseobacter denitrificans OCh 114]
MAQATQLGERRTSVDDIFDHLHAEILSLRLRPGDKISEADIAARFGVSRQPVRDAFNRLATLDLLVIRPQRATEVKRFSAREIAKSRFVRAAVEQEVLRRAACYCDASGAADLDAALAAQERAIKQDDLETFGALDYAFHETLCQIAQVDFAFDVIRKEKSNVDRLCILSLSKGDRMPDLVADHRRIAQAVKTHDAQSAMENGMRHLSRLDATIEQISITNANYFERE